MDTQQLMDYLLMKMVEENAKVAGDIDVSDWNLGRSEMLNQIITHINLIGRKESESDGTN